MLKKESRDDAKGETTIDRARNTNRRLRPEHDILEAVPGTQTGSQTTDEPEGTYDWWTPPDQDLGVSKQSLKKGKEEE